jgi:hypothetical protein
MISMEVNATDPSGLASSGTQEQDPSDAADSYQINCHPRAGVNLGVRLRRWSDQHRPRAWASLTVTPRGLPLPGIAQKGG